MLSDKQRRRLEEEKKSFEQSYKLQSEKIDRLRNALIIETDPSRKFKHEQDIKEQEYKLKEFSNRLDEIEKCLESEQIYKTKENVVISEPSLIFKAQTNKKPLLLLCGGIVAALGIGVLMWNNLNNHLVVTKSGFDYTVLEQLLKAKRWKAADEETTNLMLQASDRVKEQKFWESDIKVFRCDVLKDINQRWIESTKDEGKDRHFGFSVQRSIWENSGASPSSGDFAPYIEFGRKVGWIVGNQNIWDQSILIFSSDAPKGHFPADIYKRVYRIGTDETYWMKEWSSGIWVARIQQCIPD
ncbi:MAG: GUN4 domain-containing protein [Fischerella sp. CENA71]|nr:GUN4 domain-containing protein [Fischerella sp. CENA71]